jgi:hypothetical protein
MANRFWVGGSGVWDSSSTSNWSTTSGGAPGASAPTSVDAAIFDANSGSPSVFCSFAVCLSLTHSAGNATFTGTLQVYGGLTFSAGTTVNTFFPIDFVASSGSHTINFAGRDLNQTSMTFGLPNPGASTATWTLGGAIVNASDINIYSGTFTTGNFAIGTGNFNVNGGFAVTVNLGSSVLGTALNPLNFFVGNNQLQTTLMTLNLGTSTIHAGAVNLSGNIVSSTQYLTVTSSAGQSFQGAFGGGVFISFYLGSNVALKNITNFYLVQLSSELGTVAVGAISHDGAPAGLQFIVDINNYSNATGTVSATSVVLTNSAAFNNELQVAYGNFTCSGVVTLPQSTIDFDGAALTISGATSVANIVCDNSGTSSFAAISPPSGEFGNYQFSGAGNVTTGAITTSSLSHGGAGNLTVGTVTSSSVSLSAQFSSFNAPTGNFVATSFLVGVSAPRWTINATSAAFTCGQINAYGGAITTTTGAISVTGTITLADDVSGFANGLTIQSATTGAFTAFTSTNFDVFGLSVLGGTNTFSGAIATVNLSVTGGALTLGPTTTVTNAIISIGTLTLAGTVSANSMGISGGTLALGASTTTLTGSMIVDDGTTVTTGNSSLTFTPPALTKFVFQHGGKTYHNITANGDSHEFVGGTSPTFTCNNLTRTGSATVYAVLKLINTNITCNGTINLSGNSLVNRLYVFNGTDGSQSTLTASTRTLVNVDMRGISAAGGVLPWALGTSVGNAQNNSNITFTPAVTRFATASGAWDTTSVWSASAGGATGATIPLPQDDVQFTSASPSVNLTTSNRRFLCNNLTISNYTGTITVNASSVGGGEVSICRILGDVSVQSGATIALTGTSSLLLGKFGTASFVTGVNITGGPIVPACTTALNLNIGANTLSSLRPFGGAVNLTCANGAITQLLNPASFTTMDVGNNPSPTAKSLDLTNTTILRSSEVNISNVFVTPGTSKLLFIPTSSFNQLLCPSGSGGSFFDVEISNAVTNVPEIQISFELENLLTSTPSTQSFILNGSLFLVGSSRFVPGSYLVPVLAGRPTATSVFGGGLLINNGSSIAQETEYVYYHFTTVTNGPAIRAFGATNVANNSNITFPSLVKTAVFTSTGSTTLPNDFGGTFQAFAYGGGGQAAVRSSGAGASGGGGAGSLAITYAIGDVKRGQTFHRSVASATGKRQTIASGTAGSSSWVNFFANSPPSSPNLGALGSGGGGSSISSASGGFPSVSFNIGRRNIIGGNGGSAGTSTTLAGAGGGGSAPLASYGSTSIGRTGGAGSNSGGAGGGAGTTSSGGNGATNGGVGGSPNGGTAGTTTVDGGNGGAGGGGGGGGSSRSGGDGGNAVTWTYDYLNGVASSGTIGIGGAGGGSGSQSGATRVIGGDGGIAAGGGGAGRYSSATIPYGGSGGPGLVVLVYAVGVEEASSQIIG